MMSPLISHLPSWVYQRDGRLVPFDPDRITLTLFDATTSLGAGDAFLARELTEGILYFLADETGGVIPTTTQLSELVAKVVRELGHPGLARAFAGGRQHAPQPADRGRHGVAFHIPADLPGPEVVPACLRQYALQAVFSRDLVAAQAEGLITLHASRLLHRDIKPRNVLVNRTGRVVVLDFGLVAEAERPGAVRQHSRSHPGDAALYVA